jgi:hypothetical protein
MPATEDSVLTSLNELRRLRKERQKKGHSNRGGARAHKPAAGAHDPADDQVTPPPRSDFFQGNNGKRAGMQAPAARPMAASHVQAAPVAATWDMPVDTAALAQMAKPTSSAKPAIIVAILLLGAAGAGYVKLQSDTQALIAEKDAAIRRVEDARVSAVESAAKTERQAQLKLKACETKAEAASATASSTAVKPAAPAATMAAVAPVAPPPTVNSRGRHHKSSGGRRAASAAAAPAPSAEPSAVPNLPGKKKLADDPLAGIKI